MNSPSLSDILWRIIAAMLAGALIGLERESHGRAAGLRTTILACVASATAMITSQFLFAESSVISSGNWHPDPARLGSGILTGIGFLGAGTILRHENFIRGVTTAASLWFVTVLGLAFGNGQFTLGGIGVGVALLTLVALPRLEVFIPSDWYATVTVTTELETLPEPELREQLESLGLQIKRMTLHYDLRAGEKTTSCEVKLLRRAATELSVKTIAQLRQCPGVRQVKWN